MAIDDARPEMPQDSMEQRPRAGFWRRFGALLCDAALVLIPLQIVVAILFAQTNGAIQGSFGLQTTRCSPLDVLPEGLQPAPPDGFNSIQDCRISLFGLVTEHNLVVAKTTVTGNSKTSIYQSYSLDANGKPRGGALDVTWIALLSLLAYMVLMEWSSGATFGKRATGIRVVDAGDPSRIGIPVGKAVLRQIAMWIGALPVLIVQIGALFLIKEAAQLEALIASRSYILLVVVGGLIAFAWVIWILVSLVKKRDPIYDRLAKTAVVVK
ncbi:MAG: RDD family protein [Mesorhizobium sp.]